MELSSSSAPPIVASSPSYTRNNYNTLKRNSILQETMNGFLDKVKKASRGVVDAGAKTMLKVRSQKEATGRDGTFLFRRERKIGQFTESDLWSAV
jgi:hypothetical protein